MPTKPITILFLAFVLLIFKPAISYGDEGMWPVFLLQQLNFKELNEKGLELAEEEIYNLEESSLTDAIVSLNGGSCTGSIISPNGLMLTNHHCSVGQVQQHSTEQNNYLKDGFWASSLEEELANPGMTVSFLTDVIDVTSMADSLIREQKEQGLKYPNMMKVLHTIKRQYPTEKGYNADVHSMFNRNKFYLFIYKTYKDVRLVGIPPETIGNFGGEKDNWQWPRHTADFAMFRIYVNSEGEPAEYSPDNVPLKTPEHLKIDKGEIQKGDFSMVLGYPGSTKRSLTSYGVDELQNIINPIRNQFRDKKLEIMRSAMAENSSYALDYSKDFSVASNFWKMSKGQNEALKLYNVIERKKQKEAAINEELNEYPKLKKEYSEALSNIEKAYKNKKELTEAIHYYNEGILFGPELFKIAIRMRRMEIYLEKFSDSPEKIENAAESLLDTYEKMYDKLEPAVDKSIFIEQVDAYKNSIDHDFLSKQARNLLKYDIQTVADSSYEHSIFKDFGTVKAFLENPDLETLKSDFHFCLTKAIYNHLSMLNRKNSDYEDAIKQEQRKIYRILLETESEFATYPDANSTLRLTYGTVGGISPADAIYYDYVTTSSGLLEKYRLDNDVYNTPEKLRKLFQEKEFSEYSKDNEELELCFLTNLDITGGNSGSPVLNGKGELIGLAFDGNWKGLAGDIEYIPGKQKCINTQINYILFIVDKFADSKHILEELSFN